MFETLLNQLSDSQPDGRILWCCSMPGLRVCDFDCAAPQQLPASTGRPLFEILFCREGDLALTLRDGRTLSLKSQEILLLTAPLRAACFSGERFQGVLISGSADSDGLDQLGSLLGMASFTKDLQKCPNTVLRGSAWVSSCFAALRSLSDAERASYCALKSVELLYLICCGSPLLATAASSTYFDQYLTDTVQQVQAYMLAHLSEPLTIGSLARQFHISPTSLKGCFRQLYGQPIHQYLQQQRLQRAAELLATTSLSVMQISLAVGYGSVSQFGVAFRRQYQLPPSRYRRTTALVSDNFG